MPGDMTGFIHPTAALPANSSTSKRAAQALWSEHASVTVSSQGFGSDLSPDAFSPPRDTQNGKISDCHGGNLAAVGGKEMAGVQFVAFLAWGAELSLRLLSVDC